MRVLFLTQNPSLVGTTRITREWLMHGRDADVQGSICVPCEGDLTDWSRNNCVPYVTNAMRWPDRNRPWRALWDGLKLSRWMKSQRIDIIHCNEHQIYPFAALLSRLAGIPLVCHVRCLLKTGFASWAFKKREPDALIWCTHHMAEACQAALEGHVGAARQHVIPLGMTTKVDDEGIRPAKRCEGELVVGMACFLRPGKRVDDFFKLARRFKDQQNLTFVLAGGMAKGDEDYYHALLPRIEACVADGLIEWKGHVEPVESFLRDIDIFVSTSERESFGMSVCEAMAYQKPVAAYTGGAVKEVVGDAGLIVPNGDLDGLAQAVHQLLNDAELRRTLGQRGRQRVLSEFNPQKSLLQLESVYRSLLSQSA